MVTLGSFDLAEVAAATEASLKSLRPHEKHLADPTQVSRFRLQEQCPRGPKPCSPRSPTQWGPARRSDAPGYDFTVAVADDSAPSKSATFGNDISFKEGASSDVTVSRETGESGISLASSEHSLPSAAASCSDSGVDTPYARKGSTTSESLASASPSDATAVSGLHANDSKRGGSPSCRSINASSIANCLSGTSNQLGISSAAEQTDGEGHASGHPDIAGSEDVTSSLHEVREVLFQLVRQFEDFKDDQTKAFNQLQVDSANKIAQLQANMPHGIAELQLRLSASRQQSEQQEEFRACPTPTPSEFDNVGSKLERQIGNCPDSLPHSFHSSPCLVQSGVVPCQMSACGHHATSSMVSMTHPIMMVPAQHQMAQVQHQMLPVQYPHQQQQQSPMIHQVCPGPQLPHQVFSQEQLCSPKVGADDAPTICSCSRPCMHGAKCRHKESCGRCHLVHKTISTIERARRAEKASRANAADHANDECYGLIRRLLCWWERASMSRRKCLLKARASCYSMLRDVKALEETELEQARRFHDMLVSHLRIVQEEHEADQIATPRSLEALLAIGVALDHERQPQA